MKTNACASLAVVLAGLVALHVPAGRCSNAPRNDAWCDDAGGSALPNLCYTHADKPHCMPIWDAYANVARHACVECAVNCDCPIGAYCSSVGDDRQWTCSPVEADKIGKPCERFGQLSTWPPERERDGKRPTAGVDDLMVCGIPVFLNGSFAFYEWLGYCDAGVCAECASYGAIVDETLGYVSDEQTLMCPGRVCQAGKLRLGAYAQAWSPYSLISDNVSAALLTFVVLIFCVLLAMCMMSVAHVSGRRRRYSRLSQTDVVVDGSVAADKQH